MSENILILHVDDEPDFVDMTAAFLEREDDRIEVATETDPADGLDRLGREDIDCIVSDYDMPRTNGLEFLEAVRENHPDLPFILFTGMGSEEVASEAISVGVTDYLQKESTTDIYTVLANRVLNYVDRYRRDVQRQRQLEAIETAREGISILDDDGQFIFVNDAYAELYRYAPDELIGEHWELLYRDEDVQTIREEILPTVEEAGYWRCETTGLRADGTTFVEDHVLAKTQDGELIRTVRDISERKERELEHEKSRRYRSKLYELLADTDLDVEEKRRQLLELGCERLGLADGKLARTDEEAGLHTSVAVANDRTIEGKQVDLAWTYCRHIVESETPLAVPAIGASDLAEDPAYATYEHECYIGAPVTVDGESYGTVCFYDSDPRAEFTESETTFVELVAQGLSHELQHQRRETEREKYKTVVEASPDGIAIVGVDGRFQYANPALCEMVDYEEDTMVGSHFSLVKTDTEVEITEDAFEGLLVGDESTAVRGEAELQRATGEQIICEDHLAVLPGENGPEGAVVIHRDITDRKRAQEALERQTARVRYLHSVATDLVKADTVEAIYQCTARAANEVLSSDGAHVLVAERGQLIPKGSSGDDAVDAHLSGAVPGLGEQAFRTREPIIHEDIQYRGGGHGATVDRPDSAQGPSSPGSDGDADAYRSVLCVPLDDWGVLRALDSDPDAFDESDTEVAGLLKSYTVAALEQKQTEDEIRRERDRFEEFAQIVSHDLRNPLTVAEGGLEIARDTGDDEDFEQIDRAHTRMRQLIDDVLTLARQGPIEDREPVEVSDVAESAWSMVETRDANVHAIADLSLDADRERIHTLFENLYRNAVEHGGDDVTVTVGPLDDGFYVEDDGDGIPPDRREDVLESGYSTCPEGTGIGLAIVRRSVDAHGWEFGVAESETGGARFEFRTEDLP